MKFRFYILFGFFNIAFSYAQDDSFTEIDSLYKEDQFYAGVTYNLIGNRQDRVSQSGFSVGFQLGRIKDIPINERRNIAIGIGLGYSVNTYNQNLLINKNSEGVIEYSVLNDDDTYSKNIFSTHLIEVPLEFRWRTSTATDYKFWRIYTGFKFGYVFHNTSKYEGDLGRFKYSGNNDFNAFQYGLTLTAGYNTWNLHLYYGLNPIFSKNVALNSEHLDITTIKVGLMFYIL